MNRDKLMKMAGSVRTGGKGSVRRFVNYFKDPSLFIKSTSTVLSLDCDD